MANVFKINILQKLIVCVLLLLNETHSQSLSYSTYSTKDGLPSNIITAIMQDKKGNIWIGTNNGLSVYNATDFINFSVVDGLSNNWVTSIVESPDDPGTIWIGTIAGGLNKFKNGKFKTFAFSSNPDSNNVGNISIDGKGVLWFTTYFGLWKISENKIIKITDRSAPLNPEKVITDRAGNLWCTESNDVYIHNTLSDKWQKLNLGLNSSERIVSIFSGSKDGLWIGTDNKSIFKIDTSGILNKGSSKFGVAYNIKENNDGRLIIRSNDILFSINEDDISLQKLIPLPRNDEMPADVTSPFLIDREGNLWIGTWNKGLLKVPDFSSSTLIFSFNQKLNSSAADKFGHLWIGIKGGLIEIYKDNMGQWQKMFHYLKVEHREIDVFIGLIDNENRLWIYDDQKGIAVYKFVPNKGRPSYLSHIRSGNLFKHVNSNTPLSIYCDNENRIWICSAPNKIYLLDLKSLKLLKRYTLDDNIPGDTKVVLQDNQNNIWMGGWQEGIRIFSSNRSDYKVPEFNKKITLGSSLQDNMIRAFYEDDSGNIWVGTRHSGVFIVRKNDYKTLKNISMQDGLLSNSVWKIIKGPDNSVWLNTDIGIEKVDGKNWKVLPVKKELLLTGLKTLVNYNNKIWSFNSSEDIFIYEDNNSKKILEPAPVYITKVLVNGNILSSDKFQDLSYTQNNITFEFTALSFKDEKAVRYQYKLSGASNNWTEPSEHHFVSFAALAPGSYNFKVRAINSDGIISEFPASLSFIILQPFWLQWWFITLMILILIVIIYIGFRLRIKRLIEVERLRLRIANDLHDDVGTNLSSIILSSQIIEKKFSFGDQEKEYLNHLSTTASKTQDMLKEIVWLLNPMNDSSEDLIIRMKSIASQLLKDIPYQFHSNENLLPEKLSLEWKRNFILIFKEILQNIIKHSSADLVSINLTRINNLFLMRISDNGKGFDINEVKRGKGLTNLYSRAKLISGNLIIDSKLTKGTTISLEINITQMRTGNKK